MAQVPLPRSPWGPGPAQRHLDPTPIKRGWRSRSPCGGSSDHATPHAPLAEVHNPPTAPSLAIVSRSVMWFRRDLRLHDHPALLAARDAGDEGVLPLFVLDPALWRPAGAPRQAYLLRSLQALGEDIEQRGGRLHLRRGDPVDEVLRAARSAGASTTALPPWH